MVISLLQYLGAYVYGLNRTIPATYAAPIYPFSHGRFICFEMFTEKIHCFQRHHDKSMSNSGSVCVFLLLVDYERIENRIET